MGKKAVLKNISPLFLQIYRLTPVYMRKRFRILLAAMLALAFIETAVVGLVAFYAAAVSDPRSSIQLPALQHFRKISFLHPYLASPTAMIATLSVLLILAFPLKNGFRGWVIYRIARYSAAMEAVFGQRILSKILARDYGWHVRQNSADLIQTVNWRHHLGRNFVQPYMNVVSETTMLLVLLGSLLWIRPVVSLLFIVVQGGAGILVYKGLRRGLDRSATGCRENEMAMNRHITRSIQGVKDVKITDSEDYFLDGFAGHAQRFAGLFGSQQFWRESPLLALETLGFVAIAGAISVHAVRPRLFPSADNRHYGLAGGDRLADFAGLQSGGFLSGRHPDVAALCAFSPRGFGKNACIRSRPTRGRFNVPSLSKKRSGSKMSVSPTTLSCRC